MNGWHNDTLQALWTWTPFLLGGFGWNVVIALTAMVIGTLAGALLAWLGQSRSAAARRLHAVLSQVSRGVPTIVFQFYLAVLLPNELTLPGTALVIAIPAWTKAALALAVAVVGFTSDNLGHAIEQWRRHDHSAALLFIPSWASYLLIVVIASSTASIIGVSELVSRCNSVVNATANTALLIPIYLYASFIFLVFCYPLTILMRSVKTMMARRVPARAAAA
jgi:polar amino acid transport system permease protein